jgi:peptidyl-prolyl cis-trans isomerase-like 1
MSAPIQYIVFETSIGNFEFELYNNHAPKTCYNFAQLATLG